MMKFYITLLLCILAHAGRTQSIERVEPPFWWTGMHNPNLQLMIYGDDVSALVPSIDYTGVRMERVIRVENPNYLFLDLRIATGTKPGEFTIRFHSEDGVALQHSYTLQAREEGSARREGYGNEDVVYLLTPDRYANGNPDNDEVTGMREGLNRDHPYGRHGGDIQGIIDHLDYIAAMGFTAIWANPLLENDMPRSSYHGYATTDYYRIDPRFGTNKDYRRLGILAAEKGIKVIMDMIANHCGSEHWWVGDPPTSDWFNNQDSFIVTTHRKTVSLDPYGHPDDLERMENGWFVRSMPDLNQRNPLLATYIIQNSIWWIEYAGLAGIRQDTYVYPDKHFMADWTCAIMEEYPGFNIVGETWTDNPVVVAYWLRGKDNPDGYTSCLPSQMDFPLQDALRRALREEEGFHTGLARLYKLLVNDVVYPAPFNMMIFADNHDMSRVHTQMDEDVNLTKMAMVYIATMRGVPQIYYGTEILMSNRGTDSHGVIRSDFPGGWPGDTINAFTGEGLSDEQQGMQSFMRNLLNWRKSQPVLHGGQLKHFTPQDGVYVYFRYNDADVVMVALNKSEVNREINLNRFASVIQGRSKAVDPISGEMTAVEEHITIPARSALVLDFE